MTGGEGPRSAEAENIPKAEVRRREGLSIVWLVPLVAAVVAAWLAYRTISESGPEVTIHFETAPGLEAGKTQVMYKGVEIGTVRKVKLDKKLEKVVVKADLHKEFKPHLKTGAKFWIVEPKISVTGISDLGTLVSGNFIAFEPGDGSDTLKFEGLSEPPIEFDPNAGQRYILKTDRVGSLTVGAPVNYRGVQVGSVLRYHLREDGKAVLIDIFVKKPHDQLVHDNSRFWDAGGIRFSLSDLLNASVRVGSIESLLAGGIAFDTPAEEGAVAKSGQTFDLLTAAPSAATDPAPPKGSLSIVLKATNLGSVKTGDPVLYREFQVGKIQHVALSDDATSVDLTALIDPEYVNLIRSNTVFWNASGIKAHFGLFSGATIDVESLGALISGGVALATPDSGGQAVSAGAVFELHDQPKDEWKKWAPYIRLPKQDANGDVAVSSDTAPAASTASEPLSALPEDPLTSETTTTQTGPSIPNTVVMPAGRNQATVTMVRSHLEDLGFDNIDAIEKQGAIFHVRARWQGRPVKLRLDSNTGALEEVN